MTHDEYQRLAAAGGPSTPDEAAAARAHAETCSECRRVEAEAATGEPRRNVPWWLAAAAILFLALWIWREAGIRVSRERIGSERAEIVELTNARSVLKEQKEKLAHEVGIIAAPGTRIVTLAPREPSSSASGKLFIDQSTHRAVLVESGLPASGRDHDYQVWLYGADASHPRSGGVFDVSNGHATHEIDAFPADAQSIAVTREENGGAAQPGADVVLSGRMQ